MPSSYVIGEHFETLMNDLIKSGRYNSKSEILRDSLRMLEEREARRQIKLDELRIEVRKGMQSGEGSSADEVFDQLRKRYGAMAAK